MSDPKELRQGDRFIASLEIVKMKLTNIVDKFYDTQQEVITTLCKINEEIERIKDEQEK